MQSISQKTVSQKGPGWSDLVFARVKKEPKGQTKILGPASVIWAQLLENWPQESQPSNPTFNRLFNVHGKFIVIFK